MEKLMTPQEAADFLGINPATLAAQRREKKGPPYVEVGPKTFRYDRADLETYIETQKKGGGDEPASN